MWAMRFHKVRHECDAPRDAIQVTLFRCFSGVPRGWYIGPLAVAHGSVALPYLPPSELTLASLAIVRAYDVGIGFGLKVYIIDPDDLWPEVWPPVS